ncbi:DUF4355 domain-containing protein [Gemella sp. GH3]|uniref:DUF4355 domain-containing protein n=1 Tax=unclassified Gemella TaxID=2624949 RepID=UPI0015D058E3|nr:MULTISPECIES: DUF4355 domain-containing protein [unclassified Gemella]MBF0714500.1 DUF4355 domain-containing protein [Gemella sp. GH3.1]NYS51452.1 DUF4355 domain-containing protein [Gemella sp. GH3]
MKDFKRLLPLNLQFFAEDNIESTNQENEFIPPASQSELDSLIGKAVNKALENNNKKHNDNMQRLIDEAVNKDREYSKLSAEEKAKKQFEEQLKSLDEREAEFNRKQLIMQVKEDLISKNLPPELAETFANSGNSEEALKAVTDFEKIFRKAVNEEVKSTVRQNTPTQSVGIDGSQNYGAKLATKTNNKNGRIF